MAQLILLYKPFRVLSQFTDQRGRPTLAHYIGASGVYPAGRLDFDSEGLLLLTDDGRLQQRIASPARKMSKTYLVQVEGAITDEALEHLQSGVELKDGLTRPAQARRIDPPDLPARKPPVRFRRDIPTSWIEMTLTEGRNRQVRRMTAAVDFPTLRLVRYRIGDWTLDGLQPGDSRQQTIHLPASAPNQNQRNRRNRRRKRS
ncbi:pseudouridine synthase [Tamilnaduibacter salinus]|uniref:Pseudouridine synthase n=1 Tax=Tamilnaduibacter salinus TaxID=1484056 RepID=A0A2A2I6I2_9GAMM|nr:pseudouridine synthase [Tamilnaduibacter salinus]PAV26735.1 pseudouridine synthase [Tamilnaduibacter salinus]